MVYMANEDERKMEEVWEKRSRVRREEGRGGEGRGGEVR